MEVILLTCDVCSHFNKWSVLFWEHYSGEEEKKEKTKSKIKK